MKSIVALTALAAVVCMATPAQAQTGAYANAGYTHYGADHLGLGGVTGRLSYRFHQNFAVEGETSIGVKDDDIGAANVELDHAIGVFGVAIMPLSPNFDVFGRVGYGQVKASPSVPGVSVSADEDGFAFGGGAQNIITVHDHRT